MERFFSNIIGIGCLVNIVLFMVTFVVAGLCKFEILPMSVLFVVGGVFGIVLLVYAIPFIGWLSYSMENIKGAAVRVEYPQKIALGQEFPFIVHVKNERTDAELKLEKVTFLGTYAKGFVAVDPESVADSFEKDFTENNNFEFELSIPPGKFVTLTFRFQAIKLGVHEGELGIHEGIRDTPTPISTMVTRI